MKHFALSIIVFFQTTFCSADWVDVKSSAFVVPPPPAIGSVEEKEDFKTLHELQDTRNAALCEEAEKSSQLNFSYTFPVLSEKEIKASKKIVHKAMGFGERVSSYFKVKYKRPRPFNVDKTLKPCIQKPGGATAYPSGHATVGATAGCVLALIYPDRADSLLEQGWRIGDLRVIGGVHHPSDVKAGQSIAKQICDLLSNNADFLSDIKAL